jgi:hypothetical protein
VKQTRAHFTVLHVLRECMCCAKTQRPADNEDVHVKGNSRDLDCTDKDRKFSNEVKKKLGGEQRGQVGVGSVWDLTTTLNTKRYFPALVMLSCVNDALPSSKGSKVLDIISSNSGLSVLYKEINQNRDFLKTGLILSLCVCKITID